MGDVLEQRWGSVPSGELSLRWNPAVAGEHNAGWKPGGVGGSDGRRVMQWVASQTPEVWEWVQWRAGEYAAAYPGQPESRYQAEAGLDVLMHQRGLKANAALAWLRHWREMTKDVI